MAFENQAGQNTFRICYGCFEKGDGRRNGKNSHWREMNFLTFMTPLNVRFKMTFDSSKSYNQNSRFIEEKKNHKA